MNRTFHPGVVLRSSHRQTASSRKRTRRMKSKERKKKHSGQIFPKTRGRPQHSCTDCFHCRAFPCHTRDTPPAL
ncbi:hypothetical protein SRHO_G00105960 [Serrasalmus rhombeus]